MLKIRRPLGRLIFNMGIAIPSKTVFLIETAPWLSYWFRLHWSCQGRVQGRNMEVATNVFSMSQKLWTFLVFCYGLVHIDLSISSNVALLTLGQSFTAGSWKLLCRFLEFIKFQSVLTCVVRVTDRPTDIENGKTMWVSKWYLCNQSSHFLLIKCLLSQVFPKLTTS